MEGNLFNTISFRSLFLISYLNSTLKWEIAEYLQMSISEEQGCINTLTVALLV